jgi:hypothetical protein
MRFVQEISEEGIENPIIITPLGWLLYVVAPAAIIAVLMWRARRRRT